MKIESTKIKKFKKQSFEEGGGIVSMDEDFKTLEIFSDLSEMEEKIDPKIDENEFVLISTGGWYKIPVKLDELDKMIKFIKQIKKVDVNG